MRPTENMSGKLSADALSRTVFRALGAERPEVLIGPAVGEDAAVIRWPGQYLLFASDPIVGASEGAGKLLVRVNVNDIASKGGEPAYMVITIIAPPSMGEAYVSRVMRDAHGECARRGIAIVGGHTEFNELYGHPVLSAALIGYAERVFRASDINPGDVLLATGHIGIEGMAILASDRPDLLSGIMSPDETAEVRGWMDDTCVLDVSRVLRRHSVFMHDPTEGGFWGGVREVCRLAGLEADIDEDAAPVHPYTKRVSESLGFDPLSLVASGSMLAAVKRESEDEAAKALRDAGIPFRKVGRMTERSCDQSGGAPHEELWGLLGRPLRI
ncbi:MAG: hydrogenase expression protein [Synergistaceae bacterium]|jgi:hydrogenase maturation factor|nr:hydrogenase expression protein [Synergistaceae bacterium]